jgi:uncharacterized OB-fold protein
MARFEPASTPLSDPFWEATKTKQLLVQRCDECGTAVWYPRERCSSCLGDRLTWTESQGSGEVYTFNVMHRADNPMMAGEAPYVLALVDLDDGHRMATNIVGCAPTDVRCGMRVEVAWDVELSDGRHLPVFRPSDATPAACPSA